MTTDTVSQPPSRFSIGPMAKVWDLPLRLTHWSFAFLVPAMWWSAENSEWALHKRFGVTLLGLLIFRILWGFLGTKTARFSSFVKGPGSVLDYLRGQYNHTIGHSPLAALSVLALLGVMLVQVGAGLFAGDPYDGATGPLNPLVGVATADTLTQWHEWFYWVVLGMVAVHLTAIAYYAVIKQDNLV
ncbi:MAG: cytochrome b/b6 domain-containing protein, partial [Erythrobacter sp.]